MHGEDVNHAEVAASMRKIGSCYGQMGDLQKAVSLHHQRSVDVLRAIHGSYSHQACLEQSHEGES